MIGIASGWERSEDEVAVREDGNRLKSARLIRHAAVVPNGMGRCGTIDPSNGGADGYDRYPRLIVGRGRFKGDFNGTRLVHGGSRAFDQNKT